MLDAAHLAASTGEQNLILLNLGGSKAPVEKTLVWPGYRTDSCWNASILPSNSSLLLLFTFSHSTTLFPAQETRPVDSSWHQNMLFFLNDDCWEVGEWGYRGTAGLRWAYRDALCESHVALWTTSSLIKRRSLQVWVQSRRVQHDLRVKLRKRNKTATGGSWRLNYRSARGTCGTAWRKVVGLRWQRPSEQPAESK